MEDLYLIGSVALIHLLAVISPGPDFLVVVRNSLSYGRRVGIWTSIGIGTGISIHVLYAFVGLGLLISQSELLFSIIKFCGAAYLFFLGYSSFFSKSQALNFDTETSASDNSISSFKAFRIGFLTNVLNPKATLFFLSLFTLVIKPDINSLVFGIISVILVVDTMLWFIILSYMITFPAIRNLFSSYQNVFDRVFGVLLFLMGIKVAFS